LHLGTHLTGISRTGEDAVGHGIEALPIILLAPAVLAGQVADFRDASPVFVADGAKRALQVGKLLLDLGVVALELLALLLLA
jgi:hypothetical protein